MTLSWDAIAAGSNAVLQSTTSLVAAIEVRVAEGTCKAKGDLSILTPQTQSNDR